MSQELQPPILSAVSVTRTIDSGYTMLALTDDRDQTRIYRVPPFLVLALARALGGGLIPRDEVPVEQAALARA